MTKKLLFPDIRWCLIVFIVMRFALTVWAVLVLHFYPIEIDWHTPTLAFYQRVVPGGYGSGVWDVGLWPWYRWDTVWYLRIALEGYSIPDGRVAFAPLYPFLVRVLGGLLQGHYLLAALLISNLAALLSCFLLYRESLGLFDRPTAQYTVLYFLSFPTAFFLVGGYTESLFILLMLLAWQAGVKGKWEWVGLWGGLAVLTRFQGVALLIPLAYLWWRADEPKKIQGLALLAIAGTFFAWALYTWSGPTAEFPWDPQSRVWSLYVGWPWEGIVNNLLALFGYYGDVAPFSTFSVSLDLFAVVLFAALIIIAFRVLPEEQVLLMISLFFPAVVKLSLFSAL